MTQDSVDVLDRSLLFWLQEFDCRVEKYEETQDSI
jgi:hypothetical protein